jgi:hypothetical protein
LRVFIRKSLIKDGCQAILAIMNKSECFILSLNQQVLNKCSFKYFSYLHCIPNLSKSNSIAGI